MKNLILILSILILNSCAAWIPKPSTPCDGLYCLEWDGTSAGLPADVLICAQTEEQARKAAAPMLAANPRSTVRKASE